MFNLFFIYLFIINPNPQTSNFIQKNGMQFSWEFQDEYLLCEISSPGKGWIAVGFNESNEIVGSNLIMGAAEKDHFKMSDRFVVGFGQHESVLSLGVNEALINRDVIENKNGTKMKFEIKRNSNDDYHLTFKKGSEIYVWMAYRREDDFDHHSTMRTSVKLKL